MTRGNKSLCKYIEALYKKGCYLDAWCEYFKENVWHETAKELGIDLAELAKHQYSTDEELAWDFIDTGIDKSWLVNEYNLAITPCPVESQPSVVPTCEKQCVNCGVCKNLKTHKVIAKPFKASEKAQHLKIEHKDPTTINGYDKEVYKYRIKLTKTGILKYFSHLDWQNTFFKSFAITN